MALPEQGLGLLRGSHGAIGPCEEIQQALVFSSLVQQRGDTTVLSATLLQLGSECEPSGSQGLWASELSGPKPVFPAVPRISSSVSAVDSSPKRDIPAGCLCLPLDTSPKNLP